MHPKDLWCVCKRQLINVVEVLLHRLEHWNGVALVEVERWLEHALIEPQLLAIDQSNVFQNVKLYSKNNSTVHNAETTYPGVGVEKSLVKVVCHSSSVLDFPNHVLHSSP